MPDTAIYHIRIRCAQENGVVLTGRAIAPLLLQSITRYAEAGKWSCYLCVVMPDHLHGLFSFDRDLGMAEVVRGWKRYHSRTHRIVWQSNFFDHRMRDHREFTEKYAYIGRNPVAAGLCEREEDWPWRVTAWDADTRPTI